MSSTKSPLRRPFKLLRKRAFAKLTLRQKRVAIARDLLARLYTKRITAATLTIVTLSELGARDTNTGPEVQQLFNKRKRPCSVCAKGALLASWIGSFDSVDGAALSRAVSYSGSTQQTFPPALLEVFGPRLMSALEEAFEGQRFDWNVQRASLPFSSAPLTWEEASALKDTFWRAYVDVNDRLEAIYRNLVRHRGKLVVEDSAGVKLVFD